MEVTLRYGDDLKIYAKENQLIYIKLLEEEAIRHLYDYQYTFAI